jgi:hypothetical protein
MNAAPTTTLSPDQAAANAGRTQNRQYARLACGPGSPGNFVQVLGLSAGKDEGQPAVVSIQKTASAQGDWTPSYIPLTGAISPITLKDLVVCAGYNTTEAVGLGSNGNIYRVGYQTNSPAWVAGEGLLSQPVVFSPGTLSACLINTPTFFAVSFMNAPWVAAYRDQSQVWQKGYPLPGPAGLSYQAIAARPDTSDAGTTHAIGLTADGKACEVATAAGRGTGSGNWTQGKGILGQATGLPAFTQLVLISGDAANNFHVIGLGTDGSVWDIDQFATQAATPAWSGRSTLIAAAGTISNSKIDFFLSSSATGFSINLLAWAGSTLKIFATYGTSWTTGTATIPTSGASLHWHVVNNLADPGSNSVFILGLSGAGLAYELAYCNNGTWTAGPRIPISK